MTPFRAMSAREGWRDLRRRLPSLDRAYRRQQALKWAVLTLLAAGAVAGVGILATRNVAAESKRSRSLEVPPPSEVRSTGMHSGPESLPDADTRVESQ